MTMFDRVAAAAGRLPPVRRLVNRVADLEDQVQRHERALHNPAGAEPREVRRLRSRVAELEAEVQECRRLNKRIAEVTDIVAEVLVPAAHRDEEELRRRLDAYAETL